MSTLSERIADNPEIPFEIRKVFVNAGKPDGWMAPWTILWRECVARAILDALGYTGQTEKDRHFAIQREAQRWFLYSGDLVEVFELADLPLKITRESVIANFSLTTNKTKNSRRIKRVRKKPK